MQAWLKKERLPEIQTAAPALRGPTKVGLYLLDNFHAFEAFADGLQVHRD